MIDNSMILKAANEARGYFVEKERADGSKYWCAPDSEKSPGEWVRNMVYKVHDEGRILPDDFIYTQIVDALDSIIDRDGDAENAEDELKSDVYTAELTAWLASDIRRVYYLTQALEEFGTFESGFNLLSTAQLLEIREILSAVREALENRAEELED